MRITGTMINYYFFSKKQLWYFIHNIHFENSEDLKIGRVFHETVSEEKDFTGFKVDKIKNNKVIEYKKSNISLEATKWQLLFYLYKLKKKGIVKEGIIKFKENRDNVRVKLTPDKEKRLKQIISEIKNIANMNKPPNEEMNCEGSSYYDYFSI